MRRFALGIAALSLLTSACSLGPKEDWADAIHGAYERGVRNSTARVRMAVDVKVIETNIRQTPKPLVSRLEGVVDFDDRRAALYRSGTTKAATIFDDLTVYLPRSTASIGAGGKQRWARFNFEREPSVDIDDTDRRLAVGAGMISPAVAVEMLDGVLTGSIVRGASEVVAGKRATHYRARLSQDAAAREIDDEDRREGLLRTLETLGVQDDVLPAEVWLDPQGHARRIAFVLRQQKDRVNSFRMKLAWEFYEFGSPAKIEIPKKEDTREARRFRDFIVEFIREQV